MKDTNGIKTVKARIDSGVTTVIGIEVYHNFDRIDSFVSPRKARLPVSIS